MLPKDRKLIWKLKRRISLLLILILLLGYWIHVNYLEIHSQREELFLLSIDNSEKNSQIQKLKEKLDSMNKVPIKKIEKPKIIINKKKIEQKKDTIVTQKTDTVTKKEISDTI